MNEWEAEAERYTDEELAWAVGEVRGLLAACGRESLAEAAAEPRWAAVEFVARYTDAQLAEFFEEELA